MVAGEECLSVRKASVRFWEAMRELVSAAWTGGSSHLRIVRERILLVSKSGEAVCTRHIAPANSAEQTSESRCHLTFAGIGAGAHGTGPHGGGGGP